MRIDSRNRLLALGLDTEIIGKCEDYKLTLSALRSMNKPALCHAGFSIEQAELINFKVSRQPISPQILTSILEKSGECCCFCSDGNSSRPYQIHHIDEYHKTQNNDEENLLLVCPTHHVAIHSNKISATTQLEKKRSWQSIMDIAREYKRKSIHFPFGAFDLLDYKTPGRITEIFEFTSPRPSVCARLFGSEVLEDAVRIIEQENKIILSGESGSGKSSLGKAIAGNLNTDLIFSYSLPDNSIEALKEIFLFLSVANKPLVLIIDNANTKLDEASMEKILLAAESTKRIIIINTRSDRSDDGNIEQHFLRSVYPVNWNVLKAGVRKALLQHEPDIINYLNQRGLNDGPGFPVGSGHVDGHLARLVERISVEVETVWQFIFMLASGTEEIDRLQTELSSSDRKDIVVLLIGINQIANVENGTTITSLRELYVNHPSLNAKSPPDEEWLRSTVTQLSAKRILKTARGRYNTIHRQFAMNFIDHCFFKAKADTCVLLEPIFNNPARIKEIVILWSWLEQGMAREFVHNWIRALTTLQWGNIISAAANHSLRVLSLLASRLHVSEIRPFKFTDLDLHDITAGIADHIGRKEEYALHFLRELFSLLKRDRPELTRIVLDKVDVKIIVDLVIHTEPTLFEELSWLFHTLENTYPEWIEKFTGMSGEREFSSKMMEIEKGDIDSLYAIAQFHRRYIADLRVSNFRRYLKRFAELLTNCGLEDIKYFVAHRSGLLEIAVFPGEAAQILGALDRQRVASGFSCLPPRYWGNLLSLSILESTAGTGIIREIVDLIDLNELEINISKYSNQYHYELRVLIYQLCYGTEIQKTRFAAMLRPYVKSILVASEESDVQDVLQAYTTLNYDIGFALAAELGKPVPPPVVFQKPPEDFMKEIMDKINAADAEGNDINLSDDLFKTRPGTVSA